MIKFRGSIWKTGNSHVITVPNQYVKDELLTIDEAYEIVIEKGDDSASES